MGHWTKPIAAEGDIKIRAIWYPDGRPMVLEILGTGAILIPLVNVPEVIRLLSLGLWAAGRMFEAENQPDPAWSGDRG